jgi:hypothetical protein
MAIATTIRTFAPVVHTGNGSWVNLTFASTTGISAATPLTITSASALGANALGVSGSIVVTPYQELPNLSYKCRITNGGAPPFHNYLTIRGGDTVTG